MNYPEFDFGRYLEKYEFSTKYNLCASDAEPLTSSELLSMASKETKDAWYSMKLAYTESQGSPKILTAIANMYNDYYITSQLFSSCKVFSQLTIEKVSPSNVQLVTPEEGIFLTMVSLLRPNDHVIVISPTYQALYQHALQFGCSVDYWKLELNNVAMTNDNNNSGSINSTISEWSLSLKKLKKLIKPGKTKCIVINFPHNPTGYILGQSDYVELINICRTNDIWIFSDEMYAFSWDVNDDNWLPSTCMIYEKSIILCGMSKTFAMGGVRLGWLISQNKEILSKVAIFRDYTTICSSVPTELLTLMAIEKKENWTYILNRTLNLIKKNGQLLYDFIYKRGNNDLFEWTNGLLKSKSSYGGETMFIRLKDKAKEIGDYKFCEELVNGCGVLLAPSVMFGDRNNNFNKNEYFVRIGIGRENFGEGLDILHEFLKKWRMANKKQAAVVSKL